MATTSSTGWSSNECLEEMHKSLRNCFSQDDFGDVVPCKTILAT